MRTLALFWDVRSQGKKRKVSLFGFCRGRWKEKMSQHLVDMHRNMAWEKVLEVPKFAVDVLIQDFSCYWKVYWRKKRLEGRLVEEKQCKSVNLACRACRVPNGWVSPSIFWKVVASGKGCPQPYRMTCDVRILRLGCMGEEGIKKDVMLRRQLQRRWGGMLERRAVRTGRYLDGAAALFFPCSPDPLRLVLQARAKSARRSKTTTDTLGLALVQRQLCWSFFSSLYVLILCPTPIWFPAGSQHAQEHQRGRCHATCWSRNLFKETCKTWTYRPQI